VFEESNGALEFEALDDTGFILGSAVKHPHELDPRHVLGSHEPAGARTEAKAKIAEIGKRLRAEGRLYRGETQNPAR